MLASIKKDAGKVEMKIIIRNGSKEIPENMQGWRKYEKCNSTDIFFRNNDGNLSNLIIPKANLFEYDGKIMTIYYPGKRKLNADEQKAMDEWQNKRDEILKKDCWGAGISYEMWNFFSKKGMEYLGECKKIRGLRYDVNTKEIWDDNIRGDINMQYEVRKVG